MDFDVRIREYDKMREDPRLLWAGIFQFVKSVLAQKGPYTDEIKKISTL